MDLIDEHNCNLAWLHFLQVRTVAMEALAKLACGCEKMVPGAADLLLDMLNDEATSVRMQAMHALSRLAGTGHLSVLDNHLHMVNYCWPQIHCVAI
jgi:hypothetical protein